MKKSYVLNLLALLFFITQQAFSQSHLQGKLLDPQNEPVAFANVILLNASDSTSVYKGVVSEENGKFSFDEVKDQKYLLKVSFMGYQDYLRLIDVVGDTSLKPIVLAEAADGLDEVTVNGRRPKISRSVDRITFDVENSSLSSGNTYEILKRTPGVIVSQGQLLIKNRPATVYINDRKVYLTSQELQQLLEGFSGGNVKSVEVITNPPAKYDAEGGAILNIRTSKVISVGYKGSIDGSITEAIKPKYSLGTSQYYKNDWLNAFASYNYNDRYDYKKDNSNIVFYDPDGSVDSRWYDIFKKNTHTRSHTLNTILDFKLDEKNKLSLSANLMHTPEANSDIKGQTLIFPQRESAPGYLTNSRLEDDRDNVLLSATYNSQLNEKGASLSVIANYINYDDRQTQGLQTDYMQLSENSPEDNSFYTIADQLTNIYTGQVDFSLPSEKVSWETGLKYSGIDSGSGLDFYDTSTGTREFDNNLSDQFDYKENNYAAYLSLSRDWEKWSLKTGLRGEYTDIQGNSENLGAVNTQDYFELFPTFYLMYAATENSSFGLDYSRRITRPRFQSLNPYRYFLNQNNYNQGNPNLMPGISNKINFNYTYKNKLSFDLYWDRTDNATALLPFQNNEEHYLRTVNDNMDFEQQYSLDISYYSYLNDWWYLYLYSSFFYMQADFYALENNNQVVTNDVTSTYIQLYNQFTLSKDGTFIAELTGSFLPAYISGSYQFDDPQYGISIGLRKTFFDKRLTATINADDIFNSMNIPMSSRYLDQNNSFYAMPESRMVRFGLKYKFGNFRLRDNQRAIDADEGERLKEKTLL